MHVCNKNIVLLSSVSNSVNLQRFIFLFFLVTSLTLHVLLSRRWACFCQFLTEINIAVQQLVEVDREVKLFSHVDGGHYVSVTSGFRCVDFRDPPR